MIRIEKLNKYFNKGKKNQLHVIDETSLELPNHGLVALLGESGSGKTTLLNVIGGLDKANSGNIYINDQKVTSKLVSRVDRIRNLNVGYIFQDYKLVDNMSVFDNVALSLKILGIKDKKEIKKRVEFILDKLNILRFKYRPAEMLSGGERQRVGIARALVKNPNVILADEPTGNLDSKNSLEIMNIIKAISRERLVILVTHERDLASFFASRIIEIEDGKVVKDYENKHHDELDYRIDNNIYLKDFIYHEEIKKDNVTFNVYADKNEKLQLDIVFKNGNIYIKSSNQEKIETVDDDSSIEFINSKYKKIEEKDVLDYQFDLSKEFDGSIKYKYSSIYNIYTMLTNGFKKVFSFSVLKKILLIGFFISGMFIMYAISSMCAVLNVKDSDFIKYNANYLAVTSKNVKVDDFSKWENREEIAYILPGNSIVTFSLTVDDFYQTSQVRSSLEGSLSSVEMIEEEDLIMGKMPENNYEIVVDKMAIEKMIDNSSEVQMVGIKNYQELLNRVVNLNYSQDFTIVGIVDMESPSIYANNDMFVNIIANSSSGGYYEYDTYYSTSKTNEYVDYLLVKDSTKITKGRYPINNYEIVLSSDYSEQYKLNSYIDYKINNKKLKVVGFYTSLDNNGMMLINNQTLKDYLITTKDDVTIYSKDKDLTISDLQKEKINIVDSYTKAKNEYNKNRMESVKSSIIASSIILIISLIEIFLMVRSSFLSRIKEVGIYRAIGLKKVDIYKMFFGEIFAIFTIASIPGVLFMAYILDTLSSIKYLNRMFMVNTGVIIMALLIILVFNTIVGLLPIINVIKKRPARILARHDLD